MKESISVLLMIVGHLLLTFGLLCLRNVRGSENIPCEQCEQASTSSYLCIPYCTSSHIMYKCLRVCGDHLALYTTARCYLTSQLVAFTHNEVHAASVDNHTLDTPHQGTYWVGTKNPGGHSGLDLPKLLDSPSRVLYYTKLIQGGVENKGANMNFRNLGAAFLIPRYHLSCVK